MREANGDATAGRRRPGPHRGDSSTPSPTRPACPPWSHAVEESTQAARRTRHRLAGHRLAGPASSPTRSSGCTSTSAPAARSSPATARASVPEATQVQRARVDTAVRAARRRRRRRADARRGPTAVRRASVSRLPDLNDALDKAVGGTDLGVSRTPVWWRLVRVLQWVLVLAALAGGLWLRRARVHGLPPDAAALHPDVRRLPGAHAAAARRGRRSGCCSAWSARRPCGCPRAARPAPPTGGCGPRSREVTEQLVVEPVEAEVEAYRTTRSGLAAALR